jgi:hypothetical protein
MDAALEAHFRGAAIPGLNDATLDFLERKIVRRPAQIFAELALGEGAEFATIITDIGVVDVARDDVAM